MSKGKWSTLPGFGKVIRTGGRNHIACLNKESEIYRWNADTKQWAEQRELGSSIDIGSDGEFWYTNKKNEMFRWGDFNWERISGLASNISVGNKNNIVMCNEDGAVYKYKGDNQWDKLPGTASKVSIGDDGDIWCVNKQGEIYHYVESKRDWAKLPGNATDITVGNKRIVFVMNKNGDVYQYSGKTGDETWVKVVTLAQSFSIASDGTLTATTKDDRLLVTYVK